MKRLLENSATLLEDIKSRGASKLKGFRYETIESGEIYVILNGFAGRLRPQNSSFKVQYLDGRIERIYAKNHCEDQRKIKREENDKTK
ncbi:MAG: hypothetical protein Q7R52_04825 [archaeon]|nr:hypothetical protein [archaeon]